MAKPQRTPAANEEENDGMRRSGTSVPDEEWEDLHWSHHTGPLVLINGPVQYQPEGQYESLIFDHR